MRNVYWPVARGIDRIGGFFSSVLKVSTAFFLALIRKENDVNSSSRDFLLEGTATLEKFGTKRRNMTQRRKNNLSSI